MIAGPPVAQPSPRPAAITVRINTRRLRSLPPIAPPPPEARHDANAWDAWMELAVAQTISRLLACGDGPPPDSRVAQDFRVWARNLKRDGQARQSAAGRPPGHRHLRAV